MHDSLAAATGDWKKLRDQRLKLPPVVGVLKTKGLRAIKPFFPEVREWIPMLPGMPLGPEAILDWAVKGEPSRQAADYCDRHNIPFYAVSDGFIHSARFGADISTILSVVVDDVGSHHDPELPTRLEYLLQNCDLSSQQTEDGKRLAAAIAKHRAARYNRPFDAQPDAMPRGDYVLVIDQTPGDPAVRFGRNDLSDFDRMLAVARDENPGVRVVVKVDPRVASGRMKGCISTLPSDAVLLKSNLDPATLYGQASRVYTVSSHMGYEALFYGADVHTFGRPFYAGWGLTHDHSPIERRTRNLTLEQLAHVTLVEYSRFQVPGQARLSKPSAAVRWLSLQRKNTEAINLASPVEAKRGSQPVKSASHRRVLQSLTQLAGTALDEKGITRQRHREIINTLCAVDWLDDASHVQLIEWSALQARSKGDSEHSYELLGRVESIERLTADSRRLYARLASQQRNPLLAEELALSLLWDNADDADAFEILLNSYKKRQLFDHIVLAGSRRISEGRSFTRMAFRSFVFGLCKTDNAEILAGRLTTLARDCVDPETIDLCEVRLLFESGAYAQAAEIAQRLGPKLLTDFDSTVSYIAASFLRRESDSAFSLIAKLESMWPQIQIRKLSGDLLQKLVTRSSYGDAARLFDRVAAQGQPTAREYKFGLRALVGAGRLDEALALAREHDWHSIDRTVVKLTTATILERLGQPLEAARLLDAEFRFGDGPLTYAHAAAMYFLDAGHVRESESVVALAWSHVEETLLDGRTNKVVSDVLEFILRRRSLNLLEWSIERMTNRDPQRFDAPRWAARLQDMRDNVGTLLEYSEIASAREVARFAPKLCKSAGIETKVGDRPTLSSSQLKIGLGISSLVSSTAHEELRPSREFYSTVISSCLDHDIHVEPYQQWRGNDRSTTGEIGDAANDGPKLIWHGYGEPGERVFVKDAALRGFVTVDKSGYAGWSSFCTSQQIENRIAATDQKVADKFFERLQNDYIDTNISKYSQLETGFSFDGEYVFLALQVIDDTVSRNAYVPMLDFARGVVAWVQRQRLRVVIKRHPKCQSSEVSSFLGEVSKLNHVSISDHSIHEILPGARAVFTVNSGVGLEALLHLKPVITAGAAEYQRCSLVIKELANFQNLSLVARNFRAPEYIKRFMYVYCNAYACRFDDQSRIARRVAAYKRWDRRRVAREVDQQVPADNKADTSVVGRVSTKRSIQICPITKLDDALRSSDASHVIRVAAEGRPLPSLTNGDKLHQLELRFSGPRGASVEQVQQTIRFIEAWPGDRPMLIHCEGGKKRSAAIAYMALCLLRPEVDEMEHARALRNASAAAAPNRHFVITADELLRRNGRMVSAIDSIGPGTDPGPYAAVFSLSV